MGGDKGRVKIFYPLTLPLSHKGERVLRV